MDRHAFEHALSYRADQAGLLVSGANLPLTFQRTLMPRPTMDQAIVTGLAIYANHAVVSLVQESIQSLGIVVPRLFGRGRPKATTWSKTTLALDVAAIGAGLAIQHRSRQRGREPLPRAALRTSGYWLSLTGAAGAVIGALQEFLTTPDGKRRTTVPVVVPAAAVLALIAELERRRHARLDDGQPEEPTELAPAKALALGALVAGGVSVMGLGERLLAEGVAQLGAKVLPASPEVLRPLGHVAALAVAVTGVRVLLERSLSGLEHSEFAVEAAFDIPPPNPLVSGSLESGVEFSTLSRRGRRFVWTVTPTTAIRELMDEPAPKSPIRVYAGLESAATETERVALVMSELERTRAFDRSWLLVASPTGTGYINYAAVSVLEVLTRGDSASVALQYSARPSVLSLDRVREGRRQARQLIDAITERLASMASDRRPKLVLFGESLGAWTSQDPFVDRGTQGLVDAGIDHAIWIGTPHFSKWKEQVLHDDRPDVDRGLVQVCNSIDDWRALDPAERARARYVMITHNNDGVALFGPEIAIQAPPWLNSDGDRPSGVPRAMRWMPSTTFLQVLIDMKNSARVVPGQFAATGHDYRADLLPFFHAVLDLPASRDQLARIDAWLQNDELRRSNWIADHGDAGESMSASIIDYALREARARGEDTNALLAGMVAGVAAELDAAGGATIPTAEETTGTALPRE